MTGTSLLLDANLFLLFVVGTTDRDLVRRHKRLKAFSPDDFDLLCHIIESAAEVVVTPNTLTETSNLLGHIGEPARTRLFEVFRILISRASEEYVQSRAAAEAAEFLRLGLTDCGLLEITGHARCLLTADFNLYVATLNRGGLAENFNHLREQLRGGTSSHFS